MSHIDEGRLAAYLDGELPAGSGELVEIELHVAACADCRKLLEEELKHRNKARAILRSGTPAATEVPAFEEILRRAGKNTSARGVAHERSRLATLAWAATIVLAVGAGWYVARRLPGGPLTVASRQAQQSAAASPETTMVLAEKTVEPAPSADSRREQQTAPPAAAAVPVAPPVAALPPQAGARTDQLNQAKQLAQATPPAVANAADEQKKLRDTASNAIGGASAQIAGQALAAGEAQKAADSDASRLAKDSPALALAERKRADGPVAVAARGETARAAPAPATRAPAAAAAEERLSTPAPAWRESSQGTAMRQLGRLPAQLPDLPVLAYYVRSNGTPVIRVTYDLGGGQVLELIQGRANGDPGNKLESLNEAGVGGNEVTTEAEGYSTTLRGPVSRDSLAALLQRVR
jgi:hypothetical protein